MSLAIAFDSIEAIEGFFIVVDLFELGVSFEPQPDGFTGKVIQAVRVSK